MTEVIVGCLDECFPDKSKPGTSVSAVDWLDVAAVHVVSARTILATDPNGARALAWQAMHKVGKALAAIGGRRVEGETHGRMVDFLQCCFPAMPAQHKGLIRATQLDRNTGAYDDPKTTDHRRVSDGIELADTMIKAARTLVGKA